MVGLPQVLINLIINFFANNNITMGCSSMKQRMLYKGDLQLEHAFGQFTVPSKVKTKNAIQFYEFDDSNYLKKAAAFHLDQLEIYMAEGLVMGLKLLYSLDAVKFSKFHQSSSRPELQFTLTLEPSEHITFFSISYSQ